MTEQDFWRHPKTPGTGCLGLSCKTRSVGILFLNHILTEISDRKKMGKNLQILFFLFAVLVNEKMLDEATEAVFNDGKLIFFFLLRDFILL